MDLSADPTRLPQGCQPSTLLNPGSSHIPRLLATSFAWRPWSAKAPRPTRAGGRTSAVERRHARKRADCVSVTDRSAPKLQQRKLEIHGRDDVGRAVHTVARGLAGALGALVPAEKVRQSRRTRSRAGNHESTGRSWYHGSSRSEAPNAQRAKLRARPTRWPCTATDRERGDEDTRVDKVGVVSCA